MGVDFQLKGRITITPPIPLTEIAPCSPYLLSNNPLGLDVLFPHDIVYEVDSELSNTSALVPAVSHIMRKLGAPVRNIQAIIATHPGHDFDGEVIVTDFEYEARITVRDRRAAMSDWEDASPAPP